MARQSCVSSRGIGYQWHVAVDRMAPYLRNCSRRLGLVLEGSRGIAAFSKPAVGCGHLTLMDRQAKRQMITLYFARSDLRRSPGEPSLGAPGLGSLQARSAESIPPSPCRPLSIWRGDTQLFGRAGLTNVHLFTKMVLRGRSVQYVAHCRTRKTIVRIANDMPK